MQREKEQMEQILIASGRACVCVCVYERERKRERESAAAREGVDGADKAPNGNKEATTNFYYRFVYDTFLLQREKERMEQIRLRMEMQKLRDRVEKVAA